ncbi:MAG TPA: DUF1367 family protein [Gammaproteobacteria bacterium]|nr:DUF1367 family protein [Gammaproteobacteria bacterium]
MKLHLVKDQFKNLRPADKMTDEALSGFGIGEYLSCEIKRPRNGKFHRLFFALLSVVHDNLPEHLESRFPTVERLLWEIKLQTGRFDVAETMGGKTFYIPQSISFAKMDQDEFNAFFDEAMTVITKYIMPGTTIAELREAIHGEISKHSV